MFVRLTKSKTSRNPTVQIVESYREGKKVRQRIISSLGVVRSNEDRERLVNVGQALIYKLKSEAKGQLSLPGIEGEFATPRKKKDFVHPKNLIHVRDISCGFEDVYGSLMEKLGFDGLLGEIDLNSRRDFSVREVIRMIIRRRLEEPVSKRRSLFLETLQKDVSPCELHQVYRAMDAIEPFSDGFQKLAYNSAVNLLHQKVECFFYDATTLYFESVLQDEVRDFGFSKDGKFNQVQCLFVLVVTEEGIPVGYEVFSGKTGETSTFKVAIEKLSKRFDIGKITIVCDRGMLSKKNLDFAEDEKKMYFIVGAKLRQLPKQFQESIFDKNAYASFGEVLIRESPHPKRKDCRLILCFSEQRAKKDKRDRERLLKKLRARIEKKKKSSPEDFISNKGVKKYIEVSGGSVTLSSEAIAREEKWDGFFGIVSNHPLLTAPQVLSHYRGLWQVESTFRVAKHDLRTRPIFHWSPHRIKTHILTCFIALVLERHLEVVLKQRQTPLTTTNIFDALRACKKIIFQDKTSFRLFEMQSNKPIEARIIYEALGLRWKKETRELPNHGGNVVSSSWSVIPESLGIPGDHL